MKIVFDEIGIPGRNQRKSLCTGVGHIRRRVQPVLEKEKQAEDEAECLTLREEIHCQEKWDQPLQQSAAPEAERRTKPSEKVVASFVNNQVGVVNEQPCFPVP